MPVRDRREGEALWFKDAVFYELRVRSFFDSDGDGIGDFRGLTEKLDYLQDLGANTLWLLPFYPSPGRDDGYDIAEYFDVHQEIGTLQDFKVFLREAHRRGLRVVTELVLNHTSNEHPWFQKARRSPAGSPTRDWYVWNDTPEKFKEARIIFKDYETSNWSWDPIAKSYYWHRFYSHQPDLNFDNPRVRKAMLKVVDFWFELGVDGLRLDAVPYLFEREGTNCENLKEGHDYLRELRRHVDDRFSNRMLLAEANQWPEDAVAYFGDGDECHMAFHFPVMPRLFMGLRMEDRFPINDILQQTPEIPANCQWAMFLRNHDELTLEMVTDEERDYMYRVYAHDSVARINLGIRRRLAPLLGNDRKKMELMNALLFSLPGTPVVYYGDEIGMGDNFYLGDRNGVRTPMQWSSDRNAGFSRANPQKLFLPVIIDPEYHFETSNVESQQNNPHSMLWWTKRMIALRRNFKAFGRGSLELLYPKNHKVLAFVRRYGDETVLVVCNLSRFAQYVELDLSSFKGMTPVELFGRAEFPPVGRRPYFLSLGPHAFFWFALERPAGRLVTARRDVPAITISGTWETIFREDDRIALESLIPEHLPLRRWFAGKARTIKSARLKEAFPLQAGNAWFTLFDVDYDDGSAERYQIPIAFAAEDAASDLRKRSPQSIIARLTCRSGGAPSEGILYDAIADPSFCRAMLDAIGARRKFKGSKGTMSAASGRPLKDELREGGALDVSVLAGEQSNTSVLFGERMIMKLFRKVEEGPHPELEIGRFLTTRGFTHVPQVLGSIEYQNRKSSALAVLQSFVPNEGDAWKFTLDWLGRFFERAVATSAEHPDGPPIPKERPLALSVHSAEEVPELVRQTMGDYLDLVQLLGKRTGELHVALASEPDDPDFAPEPLTTLYQRSLYQSMRNLTGTTFRLLRERVDKLPRDVREGARHALVLESRILPRFRRLIDRKISGQRIRCHGDYHLGQVLFTGWDFHILDFEGEPARPLSERRLKRPPLRDVAGMLRSFHYAAYAALPSYGGRTVARPEDQPVLEPWSRYWQVWASAFFLRGYREAVSPTKLLPDSAEEIELLLGSLELEKAVYELGYELNNRPDWLKIPIQAIVERIEETGP